MTEEGSTMRRQRALLEKISAPSMPDAHSEARVYRDWCTQFGITATDHSSALAQLVKEADHE